MLSNAFFPKYSLRVSLLSTPSTPLTSLTGWSSRHQQASLVGSLRASHSGAAYRMRYASQTDLGAPQALNTMRLTMRDLLVVATLAHSGHCMVAPNISLTQNRLFKPNEYFSRLRSLIFRCPTSWGTGNGCRDATWTSYWTCPRWSAIRCDGVLLWMLGIHVNIFLAFS